MLSLFLRVGNHLSGDPAHRPAADKEAELHAGAEPAPVRVETPAGDGTEVEADGLTGLLSTIIANAEFLEVVYGENRSLQNILNAAGEAKRQFGDA